MRCGCLSASHPSLSQLQTLEVALEVRRTLEVALEVALICAIIKTSDMQGIIGGEPYLTVTMQSCCIVIIVLFSFWITSCLYLVPIVALRGVVLAVTVRFLLSLCFQMLGNACCTLTL